MSKFAPERVKSDLNLQVNTRIECSCHSPNFRLHTMKAAVTLIPPRRAIWGEAGRWARTKGQEGWGGVRRSGSGGRVGV
eukprot:scaffold24674_cov97-Isochrysis_galbana.AAC.1